MPPETSPTSAWLPFVILTVLTWGVYGIFLHKGQVVISPGDSDNARYKAFLFVGIAYFLIAVLAPLGMLVINGADWKMSGSGIAWSLVAGIVGALGAFGVILAFGGGGKPAAIMSLIFAGAPLVNAVTAITLANQWAQIKPMFIVGIVLAAVGGYIIVKYKPKPTPHAVSTPPTQVEHAAPNQE